MYCFKHVFFFFWCQQNFHPVPINQKYMEPLTFDFSTPLLGVHLWFSLKIYIFLKTSQKTEPLFIEVVLEALLCVCCKVDMKDKNSLKLFGWALWLFGAVSVMVQSIKESLVLPVISTYFLVLIFPVSTLGSTDYYQGVYDILPMTLKWWQSV